MTVAEGPTLFGVPLLTFFGLFGYLIAFVNSLWIILSILVHMFLIGVPIALITRVGYLATPLDPRRLPSRRTVTSSAS